MNIIEKIIKHIIRPDGHACRRAALLLVLCLATGTTGGCGAAANGEPASANAEVRNDDGWAPSGDGASVQDAGMASNPEDSGEDAASSSPAEAKVVDPGSLDADLSWTVDDSYRNYYEIFVGSFSDSDGDGTGDLKGIESRLDYVADLGCNGIWLTPIMSAPSYHKYDTDDYYLVDPAFGTNDDFRSLCEACHDKGIRLIIDLVINHSSSDHPWFMEATDYLRTLEAGEEPDPEVCPYVEYYNFSRNQLNGSYREVTGSDWYYEAVFDHSQPDLNLYNEDLKAELHKVADHWIGLGADGFRMDAVMHYDEQDTAMNVQFLHDYYEHCLSVDPDFYMVSEVWASEAVIQDYYASLTPSFFNFDAADAEGKLIRAGRGRFSAEKFVNACVEYQDAFSSANPNYVDAPFITNHDMGRVSNALQGDPVSLRMTAGLLLSMSGSPFIYYGEEIGMKSKGSLDQNKRLHMNWSAADAQGICDDPEGADDDVVQTMAPADEQIGDEGSLYSFYKKALRIRNENPEIARGTIGVVDPLTDGDMAVITKTWNGGVVLIAYNTGEDEVKADLGKAGYGEAELIATLAAANDAGTDAVALNDGILTLPGRSITYLRFDQGDGSFDQVEQAGDDQGDGSFDQLEQREQSDQLERIDQVDQKNRPLDPT